MKASLVQKGFIAGAVLLAALSMAVGMLIFLEMYELSVGGQIGRFMAGTILLSAAAMILVGLWTTRRSQSRGCTLVAIGTVPVGICCWWTIFIPALSLLVAAFGVRRARRSAGEAHHEVKYSKKGKIMKSVFTQKGLTAFAVLAALTFEVFATLMIGQSIGEGWIDGPLDLVLTITAVVSPVIVLAGLYLTRRSPLMGGALAVGGAVPMAGVFFWFPPFWVLAGAVAAIGFFRARRFTKVQAVA